MMKNDRAEIARLNATLKEKLLRHMNKPAAYPTSIKGLTLIRRETAGVPERCFERPLVGLVVQGLKHSIMGGQEYSYGENTCIVAGVDMPISSYVINPTPEYPFLFLYFYLDRQLITQLAMEMACNSVPCDERCSGVSVADVESDLLETFLRLVELLEKPEQIPIRAPMVLRELHYLLLIGHHGKNLRQLNTLGTQNNQIVQAIAWLRQNFVKQLRVDTLAHQVGMSTSSLHRHFKSITGLSPLQYHKQLRLYEVQRRMLVENERASSAAQAVGYESLTQFNREYKRLFGEPPLRDMNRLRERLL